MGAKTGKEGVQRGAGVRSPGGATDPSEEVMVENEAPFGTCCVAKGMDMGSLPAGENKSGGMPRERSMLCEESRLSVGPTLDTDEAAAAVSRASAVSPTLPSWRGLGLG